MLSFARRSAVQIAGRALGDRTLSQLARARGVRGIVLNYHIMRADSLRAHLDVLTDLFEIVPLDELMLRCREDGPPRGRVPAALTFDDGKRSHLTEVAPVLQERGLHASFFVTSDHCDRGTIHWFDLLDRIQGEFDEFMAGGDGPAAGDPVFRGALKEELREVVRERAAPRRSGAAPVLELDRNRLKLLEAARRDAILVELATQLGIDLAPSNDDERCLTPDEVAELARQGFTVGSHSATHPVLTREGLDRVWHEVADSQSRIREWIGAPVRHFCYPNGNASAETEALTRKAGYEAAWTTVPLWMGARENPHRLPRVQVFEHYDRGELCLKAALATVGALPNPDGTGRAYRKLSRAA